MALRCSAVPFDILMGQVAEPHGDKPKASPLVAPIDSLREVADLLMRSRAPLIVTEHAARTPQDQAALVAIAEVSARRCSSTGCRCT